MGDRPCDSFATTAVAVLVFVSEAIHAQGRNKPTPQVDRLQCGTDSLEIYLVRAGERQRTGIIVDQCRSSGAGADRVMTRVYRTTDGVLGNRLDTIVDSWSSVEPRRYRSKASQQAVQLDWSGRQLRGEIRPEGKPAVRVDEQLPAGVYNSASFDVVLRASPLALNYALELPAYVPGRGVTMLTAKVVSEEPIGGQAAWRVDADFTGMAVTFWISKTTRQLLKQVMRVAPGAEIEFVAPAGRRA